MLRSHAHALLALVPCLACGDAPVAAPEAPTNAARPTAAAQGAFTTVLLVSVDGLRSDALLVGPAGALPGFDRLRRGAGTLNARTDPDWTITLPNHTGMLTGRLVEGPEGHHWIRNDEVEDGLTLHAHRGAYVAGVFDVAHDHGAFTGILAGKPKFHLFDDSWDAARGAPDTTGADDGTDKIDVYRVAPESKDLADLVLAELDTPRQDRARLYLVHFAMTDLTAHKKGWDLTPGSEYLKALAGVDAALVRILDRIESAGHLRGRTAIVLTTDHGGGAPLRSHTQEHMWVNYIIPFLTWTGGAEPSDLYALNAGRRADPGLARPRPGDGTLPPVRNADAANLVLAWLGMPPVPGSTVNAAQDLAVTAPTAR